MNNWLVKTNMLLAYVLMVIMGPWKPLNKYPYYMKKVLVVDDEEDILFILKSFFLRNGYEVRVTLSCEEGLDIFYSFVPDIVLLDVNVGTADGRVMCREIKSSAEHAHIPIILVSANSHNLDDFFDYGANAIMEKPFNFPRLLSLVKENTQE